MSKVATSPQGCLKKVKDGKKMGKKESNVPFTFKVVIYEKNNLTVSEVVMPYLALEKI